MRHFEPLRPHRSLGIPDRYEFTHGADSVCVYDIRTMDFMKEIPVGVEPPQSIYTLRRDLRSRSNPETPASGLADDWNVFQTSDFVM